MVQHKLKFLYFIFQENSAICDQVSHIQEKILCVKEERRFLLKKLIEYDKEILVLDVKPQELFSNVDAAQATGIDSSNSTSQTTKGRKPYKKRDPKSKKAKKSHKKGNHQEKKVAQVVAETISVEEQTVGESLTVFELGEIVTDRIGYHTENWIYPVGYVATRIYGHMLDASQKCVYTCKITDGGDFPV